MYLRNQEGNQMIKIRIAETKSGKKVVQYYSNRELAWVQIDPRKALAMIDNGVGMVVEA